jgi:hypothetical protein
MFVMARFPSSAAHTSLIAGDYRQMAFGALFRKDRIYMIIHGVYVAHRGICVIGKITFTQTSFSPPSASFSISERKKTDLWCFVKRAFFLFNLAHERDVQE